MTTYEQLRKIIIASNESLLDLTKGCKIEHPFHKGETLEFIGIKTNKGNNGVNFSGEKTTHIPQSKTTDIFVKKDGGLYYCNLFNGKEYKIIGHPITFRHVMMTARKKYISLYIRNDGTFFLWEKFTEGGAGHHGVKSTYIGWNWEVNTLAEQSEDLQTWLLELLK